MLSHPQILQWMSPPVNLHSHHLPENVEFILAPNNHPIESKIAKLRIPLKWFIVYFRFLLISSLTRTMWCYNLNTICEMFVNVAAVVCYNYLLLHAAFIIVSMTCLWMGGKASAAVNIHTKTSTWERVERVRSLVYVMVVLRCRLAWLGSITTFQSFSSTCFSFCFVLFHLLIAVVDFWLWFALGA